MNYLPLSLNLADRDVLVVGAGEVALRKLKWLLKAKAAVRVIALDADPRVEALSLNLSLRAVALDDLSGAYLVVIATEDTALNKMLAEACSKQNILVNVVDQPAISTVIFPAIIERDEFTIALSSAGDAPVLTRYWRRKLDAYIPAELGKWGRFLGRQRDKVKMLLGSVDQRRSFWEDTIESELAELCYQGSDELQDRFDRNLEAYASDDGLKMGAVYLIGAGPGDPELLTFKAIRLLQRADVVLYDRLVDPRIVDMARRDAEFIYVGKRASNHTLSQDEINDLIYREATNGRIVARLKGGDPFIFGRGAEELELLVEQKIPFQVVPGITAASGCASYAGIPLTHRDHAQSVRFVTGHLKDGSPELDFSSLQDSRQTLVFYMGLLSLNAICQKLIGTGRNPQTPVALIERGTTENECVYTGTLETIHSLVSEHQVKAPTLIIVGDVVGLHQTLKWRGKSVNAKETL
ncbi:siroheme synthase CysG [uncultured Umboniibacter sp.]|uniref:siroheme synthase CysG n=1 Tax=uncultured Umboniibacter sp. TaxID=1798917 RepID=UPI0026048A77|nr:siroheme synthase CysG [uncultured Umboniibacter sp.]